jgi:hypothetical protein
VLDGLEGAAAGSGKGFDRATMDRMLSALGNRVFLLNNVHDEAPAVFQTRWTLSYLRGPLTRQQVKQLMNGAPVQKQAEAAPAPAQAAGNTVRPVLPPQVPQYFLPLRAATGSAIVYRAMLLGAAEARFTDLKLGVDVARNSIRLTEISDSPVAVNWADSKGIDVSLDELTPDPAADGAFEEPPRPASNAKNYTVWSRDLANWVLQNERVGVFRSPGSKLVSAPGESERDFRIRLQHASREQRDDAVEALRRKYGDVDAARPLVAQHLPDPEAERVHALIEVREWAHEPGAGTLVSAKRLAAQGSWREALDGMLGALPDDRDGARQAMLTSFEVLGDEDPLTLEYRRRLSAALF